ncbi:hypothetical protein [Candidatus Nitrosacidococcus tergens]|uniref:Uncharacterized protein n=1 Tax=Candidatus Nitrosacidococcus tergens TaxID=553981 RepID=A0A7G1Q959_9GAMM|nr:hypothetical protein [Candidatus Nitrosacidococcus tergens]CAB1275505.1 protein of unknown function [Candidatus Nitrosacidococcus tergens]
MNDFKNITLRKNTNWKSIQILEKLIQYLQTRRSNAETFISIYQRYLELAEETQDIRLKILFRKKAQEALNTTLKWHAW